MGSDHGNGICLLAGLAAGLLIGSTAGIGITMGYQTSHWQNRAIQRGYAEYNQQTGVWQWKEPAEREAEK